MSVSRSGPSRRRLLAPPGPSRRGLARGGLARGGVARGGVARGGVARGGVAVALFVAAAAVSACGMGDAEAVSWGHVDRLPALALEEALRIGSLDDPDVGFSGIGGVRVEPTGEVWVHESQDRQIRLYDAGGRLVRSYGSQGDGPGEFRSIFGFGLVGDTLWVADGGLYRTTFFSRSGELLGTVPGRLDVPIGETSAGLPRTLTIFPYEPGPDGLILGGWASVLYANLPDSVVPVPRVLFDRTGAVVDTLEMVPTRVSFQALEIRNEREGGTGGVTSIIRIEPPAFDSGSYVVALDADSLAVAWMVLGTTRPAGVITATRVGPGGDTLFHGGLRYDPRPVAPDYLDSVAARRPRGLRLRPSDSLELVRTARSAMQMPPHHRPVQAVRVGEEGGALIRLNEADASANRWIVVGEDGFRGMLALDPGAQVRWSGPDHVWVVEFDEFTVPWLVKYRIAGPPAP